MVTLCDYKLWLQCIPAQLETHDYIYTNKTSSYSSGLTAPSQCWAHSPQSQCWAHNPQWQHWVHSPQSLLWTHRWQSQLSTLGSQPTITSLGSQPIPRITSLLLQFMITLWLHFAVTFHDYSNIAAYTVSSHLTFMTALCDYTNKATHIMRHERSNKHCVCEHGRWHLRVNGSVCLFVPH